MTQMYSSVVRDGSIVESQAVIALFEKLLDATIEYSLTVFLGNPNSMAPLRKEVSRQLHVPEHVLEVWGYIVAADTIVRDTEIMIDLNMITFEYILDKIILALSKREWHHIVTCVLLLAKHMRIPIDGILNEMLLFHTSTAMDCD